MGFFCLLLVLFGLFGGFFYVSVCVCFLFVLVFILAPLLCPLPLGAEHCGSSGPFSTLAFL